MKKLFVVLAVTTIFAVACGGDGGGDSDLSNAVADIILADADGADIGPTEDEAKCMANALIDTIGEDRVEELVLRVQAFEEGIHRDGAVFSLEESESAIQAEIDCLDVKAIAIQSFIDDGASEDEAKCVAEKLDSELLALFTTPDPTSKPDLMNEMVDVMSECDVTPPG